MNHASLAPEPSPVGLRASRRSSLRRDLTLPCQAVRRPSFELVSQRTLDLSVDGVLLEASGSAEVGDALIVSFELPGIWIDAEAIVTRIVHGRRPSDDGPAIGALFHSLPPTARAALAAFLHGRPPPLPRRGPLSRLRRGEEPPRLLDQEIMLSAISVAPSEFVDVDADAEDVADDEPAKGPGQAEIDARSLVCALVGAWKQLAHEHDDPPGS